MVNLPVFRVFIWLYRDIEAFVYILLADALMTLTDPYVVCCVTLLGLGFFKEFLAAMLPN